jgi:hypothetical protein
MELCERNVTNPRPGDMIGRAAARGQRHALAGASRQS